MKDNEKIEPHILQKYQIIKKLGSGAYGHVWKAKSKKTGSTVAVKKIFDAFQHSIDAQRTFREISILRQLKHEKIIKLQQVLPSQNNQDIYLVFEYMESDLYHLLYEGKLQQIHIKYILYQILVGIYYLHQSKLIHRDLKPSNVLVNSDCSAKICDFGLVRFLGSDMVSFNTLTEGVATRWYRAPEVLLGSNSYGLEADMWSLGCILGEILLKNPLFPGTCTTNQLERILQLTGQPSLPDIKSIKAELGEVMISEVCNGKVKKRNDIFSKVQDKLAVDLVYKLLQFNPTKRLTAEQALRHQYFADFFNQVDIHVQGESITMEIDQNVRLDSGEYLNIIREKFITRDRPRQESKDKSARKVSESPKSFSDLKKSRVSSCSSANKSRVKLEAHTNFVEAPNVLTPVSPNTSLFKQLCKQKQRERSNRKVQSRGASKQNIANNQNSCYRKQEKAGSGFQSFAGMSAQGAIRKYTSDAGKPSTFSGLKKTTKMLPK